MDWELDRYFLSTPEFEQAMKGQRYLFVGTKGSGKSANFDQLVRELEPRNVVLVTLAPADFELPRLAAVFDEQLKAAHWQFVYGSFWRYVLLTEILQHIHSKFEYFILSNQDKEYARTLKKWFDESDNVLKDDFATRVSKVVSTIHGLSLPDEEMRAGLEQLLQTVRMYQIENAIAEFAGEFEIRVILDDLDRNWEPSRTSANRLIVTLLNEVQALLTRLRPNLKAAIYLRKDVHDWLVGHDPENLKRDAGSLEWSPESLELLIAKRLAVQTSSKATDPEEIWRQVFPQYVQGERTQDFILKRTLLRPRDVISFCQRAISNAQRAGRDTVSEEDVIEAWEKSGEQMLAQIEQELAPRYPGLADVVFTLFERPSEQQWPQLRETMVARFKRSKERYGWIREGQSDPWRFLEILYSSEVVGVKTSSGNTYYQSTAPLEDLRRSWTDEYRVVTHPAFRSILKAS
jgi:Cdc6-like AAA superfamily ATPase